LALLSSESRPRSQGTEASQTEADRFLRGWDQTGINAANLTFPPALGLEMPEAAGTNPDKDTWILGLINAAPYLASALM
jgi:hypothetical protein